MLDISAGGCRLLGKKRFAAGALANVEIDFTLQGERIHANGITEWTNQNNEVGIRFVHASHRSKMQLDGLIGSLFDKRAAEVVQADVEAERIPTSRIEKKLYGPSAEFLRMIHGSEPLAQSWEEGEWPAEIRYVESRHHIKASIFDLSLQGCSLHVSEKLTAELTGPVEVSFRLQGLPFLLAGSQHEIEDKTTVGIHFSPMSFRRRDELAQLIAELREISQIKHPERASGPPPVPEKIEVPLRSSVPEEVEESTQHPELEVEAETAAEPLETWSFEVQEEEDDWLDRDAKGWDE